MVIWKAEDENGGLTFHEKKVDALRLADGEPTKITVLGRGHLCQHLNDAYDAGVAVEGEILVDSAD